MNWKAIVGAVALLIVVVVGYLYVQEQRKAAEVAGAKEIVEASFVKDGTVATMRFVGMIEGPLDKVQDAVWGVERSSQMIESIKKSELQQQQGNQKTMLMQIKAGSLPLQQAIMVFTLEPESHTVKFKTTQSQAADLEGAYVLEAVGDRTRLTYEAKQTDKIAVPFPAGVLETASKEVFLNTVRGINKSLGAAPAPTAG